MGDMNELQNIALEEFKRYLVDINIADNPMFDDYYLLRFLRARKFDIDRTKVMFNSFINWRTENDVDNVIEVSTTHTYILSNQWQVLLRV